MKALTIQQPWAWAIIHAGKQIENRTWKTRHRGLLAIHASAKLNKHAEMPRGVRRPEEDELTPSAIIGVVELVDVVTESRSKWFEGPVGFVLAKPRALRNPIPCKGRLSMWEVPRRVVLKIEKELRRR
jgi:hypothetical protein